jgi:hypothetical protein
MPDIAPWIPTITAVIAAIVAGVFAGRANAANLAAQKVMELERRLVTSRLESYKPIMEVMYSYLDPGNLTPQQEKQRNDKLLTAMKTFALWGMTYASDETVQVFHRMMQASMHNAPPTVLIRMFGQFFLAARRDLGDSSTKVGIVDLLGIRLKDIYETGMADQLRLSDDEFYAKQGWKPPW